MNFICLNMSGLMENFITCFESEENRILRRTNNEIDARIREDERQLSRQMKLLLLGTGESGKTTFIKQMRIIHGKGYDEEERKTFILQIFQNILSGMQSILKGMEMLKISFSDEANRENAEIIRNVSLMNLNLMKPEWWQAIEKLWSDDGIQECYKNRNQYQLIDSAKYFFENIDRIQTAEYIPTEQDILRSRIQTTGISEYDFELRDIIFKIIDVGGQRSERKKWLHCFESVAAIIFLVAISEYDQLLFEENTVNRLEESKNLFAKIVDFQWFKDSSFILFLNKKDLFAEKIQYSHLDDHFAEFMGPRCDEKAAGVFIRSMFEESKKESQTLYSHFTCVTDTNNIKVVFETVKDTIMRNIMPNGLLL